jgi:hypothetical protein
MTCETESLPLFKDLIFIWEDNVRVVCMESGKTVRFDGAGSELLTRANSDVSGIIRFCYWRVDFIVVYNFSY